MMMMMMMMLVFVVDEKEKEKENAQRVEVARRWISGWLGQLSVCSGL